MASILEQLQVKYKSREVEKGTTYVTTTIVYQGSKELCEQFMNSHTPGTVDAEFGTLDTVKMVQDEGPFWNVSCTWKIGGGDSSSSTSADDNYGPSTSTLSMSMLALPLESHKDYKRKWNNNIYATKTSGQMSSGETAAIMAVWNSATADDDKIPNSYIYNPATTDLSTQMCIAWGQSDSDLPSLPEDAKCRWILYKYKSKPGVDHFSYPTYTLSERSRHYTRNQAGWIMTKKAGRITMPTYGDFGITRKISGDWLCEGGDISYDGRYWIATRNFTHSPDVVLSGWDKDLYEVEQGGENPGLTGEMNSDVGLHD